MGNSDLTGQRFGRLTVIKKVSPVGAKNTSWLCVCDCGNSTTVARPHLVRGYTKSCGCLNKEVASELRKTHGESKTRLHKIWEGMKHRCYAENYTFYHNYGGRGIEVCEEWQNDFTVFRDWALANGYKEHLTLDRRDVNGNYCPENCQWATYKEQNNNTRKNRYIEIDGVLRTISEWADFANIPYSTFWKRIKDGRTGKDLLKPVRTRS